VPGTLGRLSVVVCVALLLDSLLLVGEPLGSESRPVQGGTEDHIVEKRCVLLPYLVFFVDYLLLVFGIVRIQFFADWAVLV
jgi:hypothetical protein